MPTQGRESTQQKIVALLIGCKLNLRLSSENHSVSSKIVYVTKLIMFQNLKVNFKMSFIFLLCLLLLEMKKF